MKKPIFLMLAYGMFASAFAQTEPAAPCCGIISVNATGKFAIARDHTTGRLLQFTPTKVDMTVIKKGDEVSASPKLDKITAINGVPKTYVTVRPNYATPCCGIVSVRLDGAAPCCGMVHLKNNSSGKQYEISVPKEILATLKAGDKVLWDAENQLAIVQSSYGVIGRLTNSYGYAATSPLGEVGDHPNNGDLNPDKKMETVTNETDKWVIVADKTIKKGMGRLNLVFADSVIWSVDIYNSSKKFITNHSIMDIRNASDTRKYYEMTPGIYHFKLNTVMVENVPIEAGKETRLKHGVLDITANELWELRSETKKFLTSGNKPKKMAIPIGSYHLKLGLEFYTVAIKDRETVEY